MCGGGNTPQESITRKQPEQARRLEAQPGPNGVLHTEKSRNWHLAALHGPGPLKYSPMSNVQKAALSGAAI